eukprot:2775546-Rhodomonas_salina.1
MAGGEWLVAGCECVVASGWFVSCWRGAVAGAGARSAVGSDSHGAAQPSHPRLPQRERETHTHTRARKARWGPDAAYRRRIKRRELSKKKCALKRVRLREPSPDTHPSPPHCSAASREWAHVLSCHAMHTCHASRAL